MDKKLQVRAVRVIKALQKATKNMQQPLINQIIEEYGKEPFLILIACLLSLRSRDTGTLPVCRVLFAKAKTPQEILAIPISKLENIIHSVNYYKNKARTLHEVSRIIIKDFNGKVPNTEDELLSIKGVGPKTANLVLGMAFDIPAICVDTHVQKLSNKLGFIKTKTVEQTQEALKAILPKKYWIEWNRLLVIWGQNFKNPVFKKSNNIDISNVYSK
jgi:endonuclease-3